jgi:hypothetical protein
MKSNNVNIKVRAYYRYLFALQQSGATNMYGAASYLQDQFGLDKYEARQIVSTWMEHYEELAVDLNIAGWDLFSR